MKENTFCCKHCGATVIGLPCCICHDTYVEYGLNSPGLTGNNEKLAGLFSAATIKNENQE